MANTMGGGLSRDRVGRAGFIAPLVAVAALVLLGALGLAVDLGRMYITKNELQNYADASSIAAATQLDGTLNGIDNARNHASRDVNRWAFQTASVDDVEVEFALALGGPYESNPSTGAGYRFVRVQARTEVSFLFMTAFPGVGERGPVSAQSIAGQQLLPGAGDGVLPFSPDAHDANDPTGNYGFLLGRFYTLRYDNRVGGTAPPGSFLSSIDGVELVGCAADMEKPGFQPGETSQGQRGYIDLQDLNPINAGGGSALIRDAILTRTSFEKSIVPFQYWINPEPGEKQAVLSSLDERVLQDTDPWTPRYYVQPQEASAAPSGEVMNSTFRSDYIVQEPRPPYGNGRRIVTVPINDPLANGIVIGFAGFFLPPQPCAEVKVGNKKYFPCCGEYIGAVTRTGGPAAGSAGVYQIGLFQ